MFLATNFLSTPEHTLPGPNIFEFLLGPFFFLGDQMFKICKVYEDMYTIKNKDYTIGYCTKEDLNHLAQAILTELTSKEKENVLKGN